MRDKYFDLIVSKLTVDDLSILGVLQVNEATNAFKSLRKQAITKQGQLSEAIFRRSFGRLTGTCLVESVTGKKEHSFFITEYGIMALQQSMEGVFQ